MRTIVTKMNAVGLGMACGAGVMFLFDPRGGNRRRALIRDQGIHYSKALNHFAVKKMHHLVNRMKGMIARTHVFQMGSVKPIRSASPHVASSTFLRKAA